MTRKKIQKIKSDKSLYEFFTGEKEEKESENRESFADLFEQEGRFVPPEKESEQRRSDRNKGEVLKQYPAPQKTLDLHGMTQDQAGQQIEWFVDNALKNGLQTLKIVAGKGMHSHQGKAVLPDLLESVLQFLKREEKVFAFKWEKGNKKSGTAIVFVRKL